MTDHTLPERSARCVTHGLPYNVPTDCHVCHGAGEVEDARDGMERMTGFVSCWQCGGSGNGFPDCERCVAESDE